MQATIPAGIILSRYCTVSPEKIKVSIPLSFSKFMFCRPSLQTYVPFIHYISILSKRKEVLSCFLSRFSVMFLAFALSGVFHVFYEFDHNKGGKANTPQVSSSQRKGHRATGAFCIACWRQ
ncbi:MAG: hypothetical protein IJQ33_00040 [Clostridia bacterium]|nr:hypothetical protein [Clostridia bacterium]MBQ6960065.1 hypothetical protein [Clostridia bacterium]MBR0217581.1 hypothetical protein [Clostridia bacterium]